MHPVDRREDANGQIITDGFPGQSESNCEGVTDNSRTDIDEPGLQAGQRPIGYLFGQMRLVGRRRDCRRAHEAEGELRSAPCPCKTDVSN